MSLVGDAMNVFGHLELVEWLVDPVDVILANLILKPIHRVPVEPE
jgi:hypothetical protein